MHMTKPTRKAVISLVTTSAPTHAKELEIAKHALEERGYTVRTNARVIHPSDEGRFFSFYNAREYTKKCFKQSDRYNPAWSKDKFDDQFKALYSKYFDLFHQNKHAPKRMTATDKAEFEKLSSYPFKKMHAYLEYSYGNAMRLKEEIEAAARGEVDIIWGTGGDGAPEMLKFLNHETLPKNQAVILGMSDTSAVQLMAIEHCAMKALQCVGFFSQDFTQFVDRICENIDRIVSRQKLNQTTELTAMNDVARNTSFPCISAIKGGTLGVMVGSSTRIWRQPQNSNHCDTMFLEINDSSSWALNNLKDEKAFNTLFKDTKNIILGDIMLKDDKAKADFDAFIQKASEKGIAIYVGFPHGHDESRTKKDEPLALNVPCVLGKSSNEKGAYTLCVEPTRETLQQVFPKEARQLELKLKEKFSEKNSEMSI